MVCAARPIGHARDPRAGQQGTQVEVENVLHDLQKGQEEDDADAGGADDGRQGSYLGSAGRSQLVAVLGDLDDPAGKEVDHQDENPDVEPYKQQLRQAGVEKFLDVGEPFLVQAAEKRRSRVEPVEKGGKGENGGVHWHPMILLERWVIASLLSLGLASTTGAPGQSPGGKAQQKQQAPELPPWDSAQPPPPIRPPSPDDKPLEPDPDPDPPAPSEDTAKPADANPPAQATSLLRRRLPRRNLHPVRKLPNPLPPRMRHRPRRSLRPRTRHNDRWRKTPPGCCNWCGS